MHPEHAGIRKMRDRRSASTSVTLRAGFLKNQYLRDLTAAAAALKPARAAQAEDVDEST
jgi:hypothetical protein